MKAVTKVIGCAYPIDQANIDTDIIIAAHRLKTIRRSGLGKYAFEKLRISPGNVFDDLAYCDAPILLAGENFGCGSSREHAVWAMIDMGLRVVIAPSFGDIFAANAMKNGLLTIELPSDAIATLLEAARSKLTIDLVQQTVKTNRDCFHFEIDAFRKTCLLEGLDEIGLTLAATEEIAAFERHRLKGTPWLARA